MASVVDFAFAVVTGEDDTITLHVDVSGTGKIIVAGVALGNGMSATTVNATANGNALSIPTDGDSGASPNGFCRVVTLTRANPADGDNEVIITLGDSSERWVAFAAALDGIDSLRGAANDGGVEANAANVNITTVVNDFVMAFFGGGSGAGAAFAEGAGETEVGVQINTNAANAAYAGIGVSTKVASGTTTNMSWTGADGIDAAIVNLAFIPLGAGATAIPGEVIQNHFEETRDGFTYYFNLDKQFKSNRGIIPSKPKLYSKPSSYLEDKYDYFSNAVVLASASPAGDEPPPVIAEPKYRVITNPQFIDGLNGYQFKGYQQGRHGGALIGKKRTNVQAQGLLAGQMILDRNNFPGPLGGRLFHPSHGGDGPLPPAPTILRPGGFVGVGVGVNYSGGG